MTLTTRAEQVEEQLGYSTKQYDVAVIESALREVVVETWLEAAAIVEQQEKDMEPLRKSLEDDTPYGGPDFLRYDYQFRKKAEGVR